MEMTLSVYPVLEAVRDAMAAVPRVRTCRIGLEANMTPDDYPIVRIVPTRIVPAGVINRRRVETLIYLGAPVHEFTAGLQAQYDQLLDMERQVIDVLHSGGPEWFGQYLETILDEDQADAYKLLAVRCEVEG